MAAMGMAAYGPSPETVRGVAGPAFAPSARRRGRLCAVGASARQAASLDFWPVGAAAVQFPAPALPVQGSKGARERRIERAADAVAGIGHRALVRRFENAALLTELHVRIDGDHHAVRTV